MKNLGKVFSKLKDKNDEIFLNVEKLTIVNRNKIFIQNYQDILEISDSEIKMKKVKIKGQNLKLMSISKYFLEITGQIEHISFGDEYEK